MVLLFKGSAALPALGWKPPSAPSLPKNPVPYYIKAADYLKHGFATAKKEAISHSASEQTKRTSPTQPLRNITTQSKMLCGRNCGSNFRKSFNRPAFRNKAFISGRCRLRTKRENIRNFSQFLWIGRLRLPKDCKKRI